ncbi:MAG TPA: SDR family NAD(P)-dependent oxidoreductase [Kineosporiaceae bacterium]|nr:SDR family NAD(P)-dependent oxidoreductase [Kineosporiaceae bacterium]
MANGLTSRVWLITGATSGFGLALTKAAVAAGDTVVGAVRNPARLDDVVAANPNQVSAVQFDVTDVDRAEDLIAEVVSQVGRIDVLVNNAGRTQVGALEETTEQELRSLFELHFFGPAALTRAVLPQMRRQGGGAVVQMSSVGGQVTAPGFGVYCATKFALEGLTETLSQEVDFGVHFMIVEPGAFRTGLFNADAACLSKPMPEYAATVGPIRDYVINGGGSQPGDPAKAADVIIAALVAPTPPLRLVLGGDAVDNIRGRLQGLASELDHWEPLARNTALE